MSEMRDEMIETLRQAALTSGMTVTALAEHAGCHRVNMSHFVNGHQELTLRNAARLAVALGLRLVPSPRGDGDEG